MLILLCDFSVHSKQLLMIILPLIYLIILLTIPDRRIEWSVAVTLPPVHYDDGLIQGVKVGLFHCTRDVVEQRLCLGRVFSTMYV